MIFKPFCFSPAESWFTGPVEAERLNWHVAMKGLERPDVPAPSRMMLGVVGPTDHEVSAPVSAGTRVKC